MPSVNAAVSVCGVLESKRIPFRKKVAEAGQSGLDSLKAANTARIRSKEREGASSKVKERSFRVLSTSEMSTSDTSQISSSVSE